MVRIELNLREAIRLQLLLRQSMDVLAHVDDANYPDREADGKLATKLDHTADAHWNS